MKTTHFLLIFLSFVMVSCKDYNKLLYDKINSLEEIGCDILDYNIECHTVVYNQNGVIKIDDIDSCRDIFSYQNSYKTYIYVIQPDSAGKLTVIEKEI